MKFNSYFKALVIGMTLTMKNKYLRKDFPF